MTERRIHAAGLAMRATWALSKGAAMFQLHAQSTAAGMS